MNRNHKYTVKNNMSYVKNRYIYCQSRTLRAITEVDEHPKAHIHVYIVSIQKFVVLAKPHCQNAEKRYNSVLEIQRVPINFKFLNSVKINQMQVLIKFRKICINFFVIKSKGHLLCKIGQVKCTVDRHNIA